MKPVRAQQLDASEEPAYLDQFRDALADRPVLVTGAGGLIGSALCRTLAGLGARVTGSGRGEAPSSVREQLHEWVKTDLTLSADVQTLVGETRPDLVFNLAGSVRGERTQAAIPPTIAGNFIATVNLLIASQAAGVSRFINTGSLQEPTSAEEAPCSPYAASKWAANAYARMFDDLFGLEAVIVRLFMVYGPGQNDHTKLVPYVTHRYLGGQAPRLTSGEYQADWIYVDDVVEGIIAAACLPEARGGTFEFGTGHLTSVRDVTTEIRRILSSPIEPEFGAVPDRPREAVRVADLDASKKILGWQARTSLSDGLRQTVTAFREAFRKAFEGGMTLGVMMVSAGGIL